MRERERETYRARKASARILSSAAMHRPASTRGGTVFVRPRGGSLIRLLAVAPFPFFSLSFLVQEFVRTRRRAEEPSSQTQQNCRERRRAIRQRRTGGSFFSEFRREISYRTHV